MSYETWGRWKKTMLTTWGADWDNCSAADHYIIKN